MKRIQDRTEDRNIVKTLKIILLVVCIIRGLVKICSSILKAMELKYARRMHAYNKILSDWIYFNYDCEKFEKVLSRKRMNKIAMYGAGLLGELFYRTIEDSAIEVACFIDKEAGAEEGLNGIPLYPLEDYEYKGDVDAIIVTPVFYFDDIKKELLEKGIPEKKIVSLEKIIR